MRQPEPFWELIKFEKLYYLIRERGFKTYHFSNGVYHPEELDINFIYEPDKKFVLAKDVESINKRISFHDTSK